MLEESLYTVELLLLNSRFVQSINNTWKFISYGNFAQLTLSNYYVGTWYKIDKIFICELTDGDLWATGIGYNKNINQYFVNIEGSAFKLYVVLEGFPVSHSLSTIIKNAISSKLTMVNFSRPGNPDSLFIDCKLCRNAIFNYYFRAGDIILCRFCHRHLIECIDCLRNKWIIMGEIVIYDMRNNIFSYLLERKFYEI